MPKCLVRLVVVMLVGSLLTPSIGDGADSGLNYIPTMPALQQHLEQQKLFGQEAMGSVSLWTRPWERILAAKVRVTTFSSRNNSVWLPHVAVVPATWWGELREAALAGEEALREHFLSHDYGFLHKEWDSLYELMDAGMAEAVALLIARKVAPVEETWMFFGLPASEVLFTPGQPLRMGPDLATELAMKKIEEWVGDMVDAHPVDHQAQLRQEIEQWMKPLAQLLIDHYVSPLPGAELAVRFKSAIEHIIARHAEYNRDVLAGRHPGAPLAIANSSITKRAVAGLVKDSIKAGHSKHDIVRRVKQLGHPFYQREDLDRLLDPTRRITSEILGAVKKACNSFTMDTFDRTDRLNLVHRLSILVSSGISIRLIGRKAGLHPAAIRNLLQRPEKALTSTWGKIRKAGTWIEEQYEKTHSVRQFDKHDGRDFITYLFGPNPVVTLKGTEPVQFNGEVARACQEDLENAYKILQKYDRGPLPASKLLLLLEESRTLKAHVHARINSVELMEKGLEWLDLKGYAIRRTPNGWLVDGLAHDLFINLDPDSWDEPYRVAYQALGDEESPQTFGRRILLIKEANHLTWEHLGGLSAKQQIFRWIHTAKKPNQNTYSYDEELRKWAHLLGTHSARLRKGHSVVLQRTTLEKRWEEMTLGQYLEEKRHLEEISLDELALQSKTDLDLLSRIETQPDRVQPPRVLDYRRLADVLHDRPSRLLSLAEKSMPLHASILSQTLRKLRHEHVLTPRDLAKKLLGLEKRAGLLRIEEGKRLKALVALIHTWEGSGRPPIKAHLENLSDIYRIHFTHFIELRDKLLERDA